MLHILWDGCCHVCDWFTLRGTPLLWENVVGGGEHVLWAPSTASILIMVSSTSVFLEAPPLPLPGSDLMGEAGSQGHSFMASPPCQQWLLALLCCLGLLNFLYWALSGQVRQGRQVCNLIGELLYVDFFRWMFHNHFILNMSKQNSFTHPPPHDASLPVFSVLVNFITNTHMAK